MRAISKFLYDFVLSKKLETIDQFSVIDQNSLKNLKNIKVIEHLEILKVDDFEELFKFLNRTKINKLVLGIVNANSKNVLLYIVKIYFQNKEK